MSYLIPPTFKASDDVRTFVKAIGKMKDLQKAFDEADVAYLGPDSFEIFAKGYNAGQNKPKWIDVNDRCPDHEVDVLVKTDCGEIFVAGIFDDRWRDANPEKEVFGRSVLYWMPLP